MDVINKIIYLAIFAIFLKPASSRNRKEVDKNVIQKWEFEIDNKLDYPRGDSQKLRQISALWSEYYSCSTQLARSVTAAGRLPSSVAAAAFEGAPVRLPCGLCVAPDDVVPLWLYQNQESMFIPLLLEDRMVVGDNGNLSIFNVRKGDSGVYKCTIGRSAGGTVILDVVDRNEPYNVVKPLSSRGPYPAPVELIPFADSSLLLFTSWGPWSECSVCERVGRRRRYGLCYVKASRKKIKPRNDEHLQSFGLDTNTTNSLKLFKDFPAGIPCRSRHLPASIRSLPAVARKRNEIMLGLCKVPCEKVSVFEVRSSNGALVERANNTAGLYSLSQRLPLDPPAPVFESVFALCGERLVVTCPGTSLRDIPFTWRVGTKALVPREGERASGGRVHLNARDDVVITDLTYDDTNLYSCWQRGELVGTVKLSVWGWSEWGRAGLVAGVVTAALMWRSLDAILWRMRRAS